MKTNKNNHFAALAELATSRVSGAEIYRRLRSLQAEARAASAALMSGEIRSTEHEGATAGILYRIARAFGTRPRGLTLRGGELRIDPGFPGAHIPPGLATNEGGEGILAPEFENKKR